MDVVRRDVLLAVIAVIVTAALAAIFAGTTPPPTADVLVFLGRFHPLAVHLPIGVLALAGVMEVLALSARLRTRIDPMFAVVLRVVLISAVVAFALGLMLANEGGHRQSLIDLHRRLAFSLVVASAATLVAWSFHLEGRLRSRLPHRFLFGATMTVLTFGAHVGASMTHGEAYLTEHAPWRQPRSMPKSPEPVEARFFDDVVLRITKEKCGACHGAEVAKGNLRLDSVEGAMKGGKGGASVIGPRLLSATDEEGHMPPKNKPQLTAEEKALVLLWIDRGMRAPAPAAPPTPAPAPTPTPTPTPATSPTPTAKLSPKSTPVQFGEVARPILIKRCGRCHSEEKAAGGLVTSDRRALIAGGYVRPGNPTGSVLLSRMTLPIEDDDHMPPRDAAQPSRAEIDAIRAWIRQGARGGEDEQSSF